MYIVMLFENLGTWMFCCVLFEFIIIHIQANWNFKILHIKKVMNPKIQHFCFDGAVLRLTPV